MTRQFSDYKVMRAGSVRVLYARGGRKAARRVAGSRARRTRSSRRCCDREPPSDKRERCFHGPDGKLDVYVTKAKRIGSFKVPKDVVALVHPYVRAEICLPKKPVFAVVRPDVRPAVLAHELWHAFQAAYATKQSLRHVRRLERGAGDLGRQLRVPGRQRRAHQRRRAQGSGLAASRHELRRLGVPALPQRSGTAPT